MSLFIWTPQQITLRLAEDIDLIDQTCLSHLPVKVSGHWHLFGSLWAQVEHYSCSIMQPSGYTAHNTTSTKSSGEMRSEKEMWENICMLMLVWGCAHLAKKKNKKKWKNNKHPVLWPCFFFFSFSFIFLKFQWVLSAYVCLCLNVFLTFQRQQKFLPPALFCLWLHSAIKLYHKMYEVNQTFVLTHVKVYKK